MPAAACSASAPRWPEAAPRAASSIPVLHSSPAGWAMWLGLLAGAAIGLKLLLWTLDHIEWGMQAPPAHRHVRRDLCATTIPWLGLGRRRRRPALGHAVVSDRADEKLVPPAPSSLLAGFAIGFIMHRSRLCFARAFREPFMTAEGDMTKAVILALAIGIPIAALLFQKKVIDPYLAIPPAFWIGSLLGGLIFGIGMVFAGGCASGSLWRMGEGHLKLWVTMFFFSWMGSTASADLQEARPHHHRRDQCRDVGDDQGRLPGLPARR
jgi:uncharacterized membrane protein YedE/YeeE